MALRCAKCTPDLPIAALFVISLKNYHGLNGFRLNKKQYSAYHREREVLLCEGLPVYVLKVEQVYSSLI